MDKEPHPTTSLLQDLLGLLGTTFLRIAPQRALARMVYRMTRVRVRPVKDMLIRIFARLYRVDLREAVQEDPAAYPDFNAFFVRALKPGARPVAGGDAVASPVDAAVSACGRLDGDRLIQAKGIDYTVAALLGGAEARTAAGDAVTARTFAGGHFATLYLSPRDYHRVHMPLDGRLAAMRYVPGELFSVNDYSTRHVRGLFVRNERLVTIFETPAGPMALVMVGAIFVAAMETVWTGALDRRRPCGDWDPQGGAPIELARGAEMGRFNMGSTVILVFPPGAIAWSEMLQPGAAVRMGGAIGRVL